MKVLITGGAGFIGSHFVEAFQGLAEDIRVLDNLETGNLSNLTSMNHTFVHGSVTDPTTVEKAVKGADVILHCAALASVPECSGNPRKCRKVNIEGVENILHNAVRFGVSKFAFLSSSAVYGPSPSLPTSEANTLVPISLYAHSKVQGENLVENYSRSTEMDARSFRLFNVYGPRPNPAGGYSAAVPGFIARAISNRPIRIRGDGQQTRDFVHVSDVVRAIRTTMEISHRSQAINVGSGFSISINDLVRKIVALSRSNSPILHEDRRKEDAKHSCSNIERLRSLGWQPSVSLEEGLERTITWQENQKFSAINDINKSR